VATVDAVANPPKTVMRMAIQLPESVPALKKKNKRL
jgi:hypothetical protein